jgi:hypothetical protein
MVPYIAGTLVLAAVFGMGRCSAPDSHTYYKVVRPPAEVVEHEVKVPSDIPASCKAAAAMLVDLQQKTEDIDVAAGRLAVLADQLGTYVNQPDAQFALNDTKQQATDFRNTTGTIGTAVLTAQQDYKRQVTVCDHDLKGR